MLLKEIASSIEEAVVKAIAGGHWQRYEGPNIRCLETQLANRLEQREVQLTCSGTAALEIVLRAASVGNADEVLISSYDYPGNFWAIERVGARPVLVDTEARSWRIDLKSLDRAFQPACKALIASHLHGELQRVDELRDWCQHRKVLLIEDACQALGARWRGSPVGSYGHVAILSFGGGKLLSCGRGGAWATSDESLAIKARVASGAGSGPYALSELQAATVLAQLPWLDDINRSCRDYFRAVDRQLKVEGCDWTFVPLKDLDCTAFYQCGWQLSELYAEEDRHKLVTALQLGPQITEATARELPFGVGFPGFHRRSARRCRIPSLPSHAAAAAICTLVVHHRVVLQQQWSPDELANWITACIARTR
jgi:perosamine synthetase